MYVLVAAALLRLPWLIGGPARAAGRSPRRALAKRCSVVRIAVPLAPVRTGFPSLLLFLTTRAHDPTC
jgi:hypothetical protein